MFQFGSSKKHNTRRVHFKYNNKTEKQHHGKKNIVVGLVHAEWCGHCKSLMPQWDEMEKKIKNDSKLSSKCEIVKIDSEHVDKELPKYKKMTKAGDIQVGGYPTLFLINNRNLEMYGGERTGEALYQWVNQHANNSIVGGKKRRKSRRNRKSRCKSCYSLKLW